MVIRHASENPPGRRSHDHRRCVEQALGNAEEICAGRGVRLTPLRLKVLELIWGGHRPISAYDLLDRLSEGQKKAAPPTVYRALDFLMEEGLIHRLESLNAYIGCPDPMVRHNGQFLICQKCRSVMELNDPSIREALAQSASRMGFTIDTGMVEIMGLCPQCQRMRDAGTGHH